MKMIFYYIIIIIFKIKVTNLLAKYIFSEYNLAKSLQVF